MSGRDCQDRDEGLSACGCDVPVAKTSDDDDDVVEHLWQVRDIQFGLVSGALLLAGFLSGLAGWEAAELGWSAAALLVGGSTFVPGALRKLAKEGSTPE